MFLVDSDLFYLSTTSDVNANTSQKRVKTAEAVAVRAKLPKTLLLVCRSGTLVKEEETGRVLADVSSSEPYIVARGGKGGWGNPHFATPVRPFPRFANPVYPEKSLMLLLNLNFWRMSDL